MLVAVGLSLGGLHQEFLRKRAETSDLHLQRRNAAWAPGKRAVRDRSMKTYENIGKHVKTLVIFVVVLRSYVQLGLNVVFIHVEAFPNTSKHAPTHLKKHKKNNKNNKKHLKQNIKKHKKKNTL